MWIVVDDSEHIATRVQRVVRGVDEPARDLGATGRDGDTARDHGTSPAGRR
jgi:hypothetical protein